MNRNLTLAQRIHNCAAAQEVEFVHAMHTYFHAKANATEEWGQIWSTGNPDIDAFDTASWAHFFGRMRGWRSVWHGSVTLYDQKAFWRFFDIAGAMPEVGGLDPRAIYEVSCHSLASDIIEVADDGRSARATFFTPGNIFSAPSQTLRRRSSGLWERYGADFVYEDGCWLFLHEQVCPDLATGCDTKNPGLMEYQKLLHPEQGKPMASEGGVKVPFAMMPDCEDPGPLHSEWTPIKVPVDTVPWPRPYRTLDNENSYTKDRCV